MIVSYFIGKIPLRPLELAIDRINQLADGDFKVKLEYGEPFIKHSDFRNLSESFNKLAEELQKKDFITLTAAEVMDLLEQIVMPVDAVVLERLQLNRERYLAELRTFLVQ